MTMRCPAPVGGRLANPVTVTCAVLIGVAIAVLAVRFFSGLGR
jgi:hypothetical protein